MKERVTADAEPRVGIFWLLPGSRLLFDVTPVSQAEPYGNALTHARAHIAHWDALRRLGQVEDVEYEFYPRGRVSYFPLEGKFGLFADRCILKRAAVLRRILTTMHLPPDKTELHGDSHYRCAACLRKSRC